MMEFIFQTFTVYGVTLILTRSKAIGPIREVLKKIITIGKTNKVHFTECRMCVGFWVSIIVCAIDQSLMNILPVYAASYFIATQERY